jgi:hypothetical protein
LMQLQALIPAKVARPDPFARVAIAKDQARNRAERPLLLFPPA